LNGLALSHVHNSRRETNRSGIGLDWLCPWPWLLLLLLLLLLRRRRRLELLSHTRAREMMIGTRIRFIVFR
jgi:MYXO-CTERM domain-containing protein